jgi:hypothetical protein
MLGLSSDDLFVGYNPAFGRGGGSMGVGGTVVVNSSDDIITRGTGANGIFAQSVGGGGGVAGSLDNNGNSLNFSGSVGGVGNGGTVSVAHTGNITTLGNRSCGIFNSEYPFSNI